LKRSARQAVHPSRASSAPASSSSASTKASRLKSGSLLRPRVIGPAVVHPWGNSRPRVPRPSARRASELVLVAAEDAVLIGPNLVHEHVGAGVALCAAARGASETCAESKQLKRAWSLVSRLRPHCGRGRRQKNSITRSISSLTMAYKSTARGYGGSLVCLRTSWPVVPADREGSSLRRLTADGNTSEGSGCPSRRGSEMIPHLG
jgi:hypothetical protein